MAESARDRQLAELQREVRELKEFRNRLGEFQRILIEQIAQQQGRIAAIEQHLGFPFDVVGEAVSPQPKGATSVKAKLAGLEIVAR